MQSRLSSLLIVAAGLSAQACIADDSSDNNGPPPFPSGADGSAGLMLDAGGGQGVIGADGGRSDTRADAGQFPQPTERPQASLVPEQFELPHLSAGQSADRIVRLTNVGDGRLAILGLEGRFGSEFELFRRGDDGNDEYLIDFEGTVHAALPITLGAEETLTFVLNYTPGSDDERPVDPALVLDTNLPEGEIVVPILFDADGPAIQVAPAILHFDAVEPGTEATLEATVTNVGHQPLHLQQIRLNGPDTFTLTAAHGEPLTPEHIDDPDQDGEEGLGRFQSMVIGVQYAPRSRNPEHAEVLITSDDPRRREVVIALHGNAPHPQVQVAPDPLSFGAAGVGTTVHRPLSIISTGDAPLEIHAIELDDASDPAFSIDMETLPAPLRRQPPEPEILPPGADEPQPPERTIGVQFNPQEERAHSGRLTIRTNDPARPEITVTLTGHGGESQCPIPGFVGPSEFEVSPLDIVTLSGEPSVGADGGPPRRYEWIVIERPEHSTSMVVERFHDPQRPADGGQVDDPTTPGAAFFVDLVGHYTFALRVVDAAGVAAPSEACPDTGSAIISVDAQSNNGIHAQLVWRTPGDPDQTDTEGSDVDLHLLHPQNAGWMLPPGDCYYANPNPDWGVLNDATDNPSIDIDDTNGAGPENISLRSPENTSELEGPYRIGVHYYRSDGFFDGRSWGPSLATLRVYLRGELAWENAEGRELAQTDAFWEAVDVNWTQEDPSIEVVDVMTTLEIR